MTSYNEALARIDELEKRIRLAHEYCDDPGNWGTYDSRRKLLMMFLDGTFKSLPIKKGETR